jgi:hypothetical protein
MFYREQHWIPHLLRPALHTALCWILSFIIISFSANQHNAFVSSHVKICIYSWQKTLNPARNIVLWGFCFGSSSLIYWLVYWSFLLCFVISIHKLQFFVCLEHSVWCVLGLFLCYLRMKKLIFFSTILDSRNNLAR